MNRELQTKYWRTIKKRKQNKGLERTMLCSLRQHLLRILPDTAKLWSESLTRPAVLRKQYQQSIDSARFNPLIDDILMIHKTPYILEYSYLILHVCMCCRWTKIRDLQRALVTDLSAACENRRNLYLDYKRVTAGLNSVPNHLKVKQFPRVDVLQFLKISHCQLPFHLISQAEQF